MSIRRYFDQQLSDLRDRILLMGSRVQDELHLAMSALNSLDMTKADAVFAADRVVNETRFEIEELCFTLIVTQQPAARDLRTIIAAMNVIVDLERMGDQAKGIAKVVPHVIKNPTQERPPELRQMDGCSIRRCKGRPHSCKHQSRISGERTRVCTEQGRL